MSNSIQMIIQLLLIIGWLVGTVLAKGFWFTVLSIICPCYAWYLVVELLMIKNGLI